MVKNWNNILMHTEQAVGDKRSEPRKPDSHYIGNSLWGQYLDQVFPSCGHLTR